MTVGSYLVAIAVGVDGPLSESESLSPSILCVRDVLRACSERSLPDDRGSTCSVDGKPNSSASSNFCGVAYSFKVFLAFGSW